MPKISAVEAGAINEGHAADLVLNATGFRPKSVERQSLTESGNAVFRVGLADRRPVVLRVSPRPRAFAFTGLNLGALRGLGLPVQRVLGAGPTSNGGSFIILDWLPGRDLVRELPRLDQKSMAEIARTVTDFQKRIGTLPLGRGFGWASIGGKAAAAAWSDLFGPQSTEDPPAADGSLDRLRARLRAVRRSVEPYFATVKPVCFLDDLTIKNVLVEGGQVCGIIDVDSVCYGDPLMSAGTTIALIAADSDAAARLYGEELLRCWEPDQDARRAVGFYAALWAVGMLNTAVTAGDAARIARLETAADELLRSAGSDDFVAVSTPMTADQRLELATGRHRAGDLSGARRLYEAVLAEVPGHGLACFRLGLLEMQLGRAEAALPLIGRAIAGAPGEVRYHFGKGEALAALRRWEEAAAAYRVALAIDPGSADLHFSLGVALQAMQDHAGAIAAYETATRLQPDHADAFNNLGQCRKLTGDLPKAEAALRRAIAVRPGYAGALSNLGAVVQELGRMDEAVELFRGAAAMEPVVVGHAVNLGGALCARRQFSEAAEVLGNAVQTDPASADAAFNLGNALHGLGRLPQAVEQYRRAVVIRPDHAEALNNLGNVHKQMGDFKSALADYDAAIGARPDAVVAVNNLGCLLRTLGRLEEAEAVLRAGLSVDANHPALHDNLGSVLKDAGDLESAIACFRRALELNPADAATHGNLAYALSFWSDHPRPILDECRRWNALHAAPLRSQIKPPALDPTPGRRLRIGYVSPDFRDHCQSLFTIPLLSRHDHWAFEIFCYSGVERPDEFTRRIKGYADVWRDVRALDDAALADLIRNDRIDILVDLTMHMAHGRPGVFARKPAPIQIAWLAYPGTTGIAAMDYRLTDPRLDPPGFENHYTEQTIHLPDSFWCYDPLAAGPAVNDLPCLSVGHVTFGCLNNPCKLTDHTLRMWGAVMRELPSSRLLLMAPESSHRARVLSRLDEQGVSAGRVEFVSFQPRAGYLRTYHRIDIGLDTFPYNGHTTSLDSFWMGVPVVTRVGRTCVGRAGLSQLHNLGLAELSTESEGRFVDVAVDLANDPDRLADLRRTLRARLERSPLMDAERFAKNVEAAYRRVHQNRQLNVVASAA
jgi:predicted O-linked N-acetylglucosamine transferase (SPINDLY family)/aminoglycoside phosphotransferase (APT) family kinase protein